MICFHYAFYHIFETHMKLYPVIQIDDLLKFKILGDDDIFVLQKASEPA